MQDCWRLWLRLQGDRPGWLENNVWVFPRAVPGKLCHLCLCTPKGRLYHPDKGPAGVRIGSFVVSKRKYKRKHGIDLLVIYSNSYWFKSLKIAGFASIWSELASGVEDLQQAKWGIPAGNPACLLGSQLSQGDPHELRRKWIRASQWKQQAGDTDIPE